MRRTIKKYFWEVSFAVGAAYCLFQILSIILTTGGAWTNSAIGFGIYVFGFIFMRLERKHHEQREREWQEFDNAYRQVIEDMRNRLLSRNEEEIERVRAEPREDLDELINETLGKLEERNGKETQETTTDKDGTDRYQH